MNAFMRRSLRLMLMASLGFFQTLVHTYAADAPTMLNCPGTRSDLSLDTGDWVILGDCEMGNVNLSGSAHLFFLPTTADQSKLVRSRVTLAGHTALKDSSVILFNSVDITFPQTFINEFWLEARDQSRVMVAQSTVLTMDKADVPTQSMFWRFFDDSKLAVMGSSRLVNSWLLTAGHTPQIRDLWRERSAIAQPRMSAIASSSTWRHCAPKPHQHKEEDFYEDFARQLHAQQRRPHT
jgi:hypothetical protein